MVRTQIQLSGEQSLKLKQLAAAQGKSMAELIRGSVDTLLATTPMINREELKTRALALAGIAHGPADLAENHDLYLIEAYEG